MIACMDSIHAFMRFLIFKKERAKNMAVNAVQGISTYQTYLMYRTTTSGTYQRLIDITSFPDLIPPKERIDITTLSDYMRKH